LQYIKLSTDRKLLDDSARKDKAKEVYGELITTFYDKHKDGKTNEPDRDFPHYSTAKLAWDKDAFLAAELGCRAVMRE
jgi:hypothetical protein